MLEVWLRGPLPEIPPLVQPVAHALLQAKEEINALVKDFPDRLMWERPGGLASVAFHLQHICGVLDRLFTYAAGKSLTEEQLAYLKSEGVLNDSITKALLIDRLEACITQSIKRLQVVNETTLTDLREVGRQKLPSTQLGLLFHAAEHTMRHTGQLHVTVKWLMADKLIQFS